MLEKIWCLEKDMDNMRGLITHMLASAGEEKKNSEQRMVKQVCRINDQDRRIAAQLQ